MAAKKYKKADVGPDRSHTRMQIAVPNDVYAAFKAWCAINHTDMTTDINEFIALRIASHSAPLAVPLPAKRKPRK